MPRYSFVSILAILPMASSGLLYLFDKLDSNVIHTSIKVNILFGIIASLVLGGIVSRKASLTREKVSNTVLSQVFPYHTYVPLNIYAHKSVKEEIYVPYYFKKINIIYWVPNAPLESKHGLKLELLKANGEVVSKNKKKDPGLYIIKVKNITSKLIPIAISKSYRECQEICVNENPFSWQNKVLIEK